MENIEIRNEMRSKRIYSYEVAEALGLSESAFSRKMRKQLSQEETQRILSIIRKLAKGGA